MDPKHLRRASALAALILLPVFATQAETLTAEFVGKVYVSGLSADGKVAVGQTIDNYETFRWQSGGRVTRLGRGTLETLSIISGSPAVSADGKVVASTILSDDGTYSTAARWTQAGGWQMLTGLPPGGGNLDNETCSAYGMSGDGQVITGLFWRPGASDGSAHGMRWTSATGMVDMGSDGRSSRIDAANADGSVLVGWDEHPTYGNRRAAVWVNGVKTILSPSDWPSEATSINAAGTVIVGNGPDPLNPTQVQALMWKWNGSTWTTTVIGVMNGRGKTGIAYATGVSEDGSFVTGVARKDVMSPASVGFVWTEATGMVEATAYLESNGMTPGKAFKIYNISALSGDGKTFAVAEQLAVLPYTKRARLIHRAP
jgi:uncharacterized membrane protein